MLDPEIETGISEFEDDEGWGDEPEAEETKPRKRGRSKNQKVRKGDPEPDGELWEDPIESLTDMLDGGADQISVFRVPARGQREFVDSFDVASFTLPGLREQYGPGKYFIRVRANGRWRPGGKFVSLAAREEDIHRWTPGSTMARPQRNDDDDLSGKGLTVVLLKMLLEQRAAPQQSFSDIMAEMTRGAAAQTTALMTLFAEMQSKNNGSERRGLGDMVEDMRAVMALKDEFGGESDEGSPLAFLKPIMPVLAQAIARGAEEKPVGTQSQEGNDGSGVAEPATLPAQPKVSQSPLSVLAPYIEHALGWAKENQNPEAWAAVVDSQAPQAAELIGRLYDAYEDPNGFYGELERLYPDVAQHRTWLERFVNSLIGDDEELEGPENA